MLQHAPESVTNVHCNRLGSGRLSLSWCIRSFIWCQICTIRSLIGGQIRSLYNVLLPRRGYVWFIRWQIEVVLVHQIFDWEPNWLYQILVQRTLIETRLCLVQTFVADCFLLTLQHLVSVLLGATIFWCFSLVLLIGSTVWCFCLVLLFGAGGRLFFGDVLWCRLRLVPGLDWWPPSLLVVVQCGPGLPRVSF